MPNLKIEVSSDFKNIYLKSDDSDTNTDYPVLELYIDDTLQYTFTVGGSDTTIGSTTYTQSSGVANLDYASTTTSIGTEYIFTINSNNLGLTSDQILDDGIYQFKLIDNSETQNLFIGAIIHDDIDCCIADKLDAACDTTSNCSIDGLIENANKIYALLYSAKKSAKDAEFTNALCKFNIAKLMCDDNCGCGCS